MFFLLKKKKPILFKLWEPLIELPWEKKKKVEQTIKENAKATTKFTLEGLQTDEVKMWLALLKQYNK